MRNLIISCMLLCITYKSVAQADSAILWMSNQISVCWINPTDSNATEREYVQRAIKKTWEASSRLTFSGWCKCDSFRRNQENGIRILIANDRPKVYSIGHDITYDSVGMQLSFEFPKGIYLPIKTTRYKKIRKEFEGERIDQQVIYPQGADKQIFIEAMAVHEFGHALGFVHEHAGNCNYGPDCKFPENAPVMPSILSATCNERSVMNYCNDVYLNEGYLSYFDRELLQLYYGKKEQDSSNSQPIKISYTNGKPIKAYVMQQQSQRQPLTRKIKTKRQNVYIQLTGDSAMMKDIIMVEYFFHRNTFDPVKLYQSKSSDYLVLLKKVWGNFTCEAKLHFKNGDSYFISTYIIANPKIIRKAGWDLRIFRDPGSKS